MESTRQVIERHLVALKSGDVDLCMADYGDEIVLLRDDVVIKGIAQLRVIFEEGFRPGEMFEPGASEWVLDSLICDGEYAWMTWHHSWGGGTIPFGADAFQVRDGKIIMQTGAWYTGPAN